MAYGGRVDGAGTDEPDQPATGGLAILTHPEDPPVPAYVFSAADEFGFLAAAPLMHGPREIAKGATLTLRYRTVVLGSLPVADEIERLHAQYA